jgi:hypothetical protein
MVLNTGTEFGTGNVGVPSDCIVQIPIMCERVI